MDLFGIKLESVVIKGCKDSRFFAKLILIKNGKRFELDSPPSDAITLTLNTLIPIFVEPEVLESAGTTNSDGTKQ